MGLRIDNDTIYEDGAFKKIAKPAPKQENDVKVEEKNVAEETNPAPQESVKPVRAGRPPKYNKKH